MAGIGGSETSGRSGRRALDSDINMIPMIDLLMVTISFLLITAVWSHMGQLDAKANGRDADPRGPRLDDAGKLLDIDMRTPGRFVLRWMQEGAVLDAVDVARDPNATRFEELASAVKKEWERAGVHRAANDPARDAAVLHVPNDVTYEQVIGALDAIRRVRRPVGLAARAPSSSAFQVTLASD